MTEEFIITLVEPAPFNAKRTHCRRGHEFLPGSYHIRRVCVRGKFYEARECKACIAFRQRQYKKRRREQK